VVFSSIRSKISTIILAILLLSTAVIVWHTRTTVLRDMGQVREKGEEGLMGLFFVYLDAAYMGLQDHGAKALETRKRAIRDNAAVLLSAMDRYYDMATQGIMSEDKAKKAVYELVRKTRFGNGDYFYLLTSKLHMVAHADPSMEGQDISTFRDVQGVPFGQMMLKLAQDQKEGFLSIYWTKLGAARPVPKLLYVRTYPKWDWILGTGIYIDDIDEEVTRERERIVQDLRLAWPRIENDETGELFIFDDNGRVVVPPRKAPPGFADIVNLNTGRKVLEDLAQAARGAGQLVYEVRDSQGLVVEKQANVRLFTPFNWYVAAATESSRVEASAKNLIRNQLVIGVTILVLAMGLIAWVVGRVCAPLTRLTGVAGDIADGDLATARRDLAGIAGTGAGAGPAAGEPGQEASPPRGLDETGRLLRMFATMTDNLHSLVVKVQRSGTLVKESAERIARSSRGIETAVEEQAAATRQVSATAREISATSADLALGMNEVSLAAKDAALLADDGLAGLINMGQSMERLSLARQAISVRLAAISEQASGIGRIVVTISKVSEKINLLSLNASIEAEKAGEYGQGFSVVAREVRKLADQTEVAVHDIARVIEEMRSAVADGVMEMDKFDHEVSQGVRDVASISGGLGEVIERVRSLEPRLASANQAMQGQNLGAGQISQAMEELHLTVEATKNSLHEFMEAAARLSEAIVEMESEVSHFTLE
jgi:methyl-accepting chemotaxis protein WspA